jgi:hypothetical protein
LGVTGAAAARGAEAAGLVVESVFLAIIYKWIV